MGRLPHLGRLHLNEISQVLKEKYFLHLRRLDPANYRYRDPYYDEKRLWVCRLVAQFLMDGALVVSIDETHFRHDALKRRATDAEESKTMLANFMRHARAGRLAAA